MIAAQSGKLIGALGLRRTANGIRKGGSAARIGEFAFKFPKRLPVVSEGDSVFG